MPQQTDAHLSFPDTALLFIQAWDWYKEYATLRPLLAFNLGTFCMLTTIPLY